jgi:hypothetical protein
MARSKAKPKGGGGWRGSLMSLGGRGRNDVRAEGDSEHGILERLIVICY